MSAQPLEARLAHMEGAFSQVADRLNGIERRLDAINQTMDARFVLVDERFGRLEQSLDSRFAMIDQRFTWLIGIVVATWITTILTVLFHH